MRLFVGKRQIRRIGYLFILLSFLKPAYLGEIPFLDMFFNAGRIMAFLILFAKRLIVDRKFSPLILCALVYTGIPVLMTIANSGDYVQAFIFMGAVVGATMLIETLIKKDATVLISTASFLYELSIYINLLTIILFPAGLYQYTTTIGWASDQVWFFGLRNSHPNWLVCGLFVCGLNRNICKNKVVGTVRFICLYAATVYTIVLLKSGGGYVMLTAYTLLMIIFVGFGKCRFSVNLAVISQVVLFLAITAFSATALFASFFSLFGKDGTATGRIAIWLTTWKQVVDKPLFGHGIMKSQNLMWLQKIAAGATTSHNTMLDVLFRGGIVGFAAYLVCLFTAGRQLNLCKDSVRLYNFATLSLFCMLLLYQSEGGAGNTNLFIILSILYYYTKIQEQHLLVQDQIELNRKIRLTWVPPIWLEEDETVVTNIKQAYVSFDIFDTLIKRSVARPADLFRMMEQNGPDVPEHFAEKRMEAERAAHARLGVRTGLADIYEELLPLYGCRTNDLMALEIQYEIAGCRPNPDCIDLLNRCVAQDKTVLLLSDMYLPSSVLRKMLDRCGVYHYDRLYVSCEEGACKADGSLFWKVVADQEIRPTELCHIGDNRRSDGLEPWRVGVHIRHVKNGQKTLCAGDRELPTDAALYERTLRACIRNCEENLDSDYARLGCETFGPLLAGFTAWLREQLLRDGIQDVYFMARDGYMMKQAFDALGDGRFRTHYLYCSRRSFTVPLLWKHPELQDIFKNVTIQPRMTLRVLILRLGLEPENCAEQARACGLDLDFVFENDSLRTSEQVAAFYESIRERVIANSKREYEALLAYIHSCGMQGRVAVVDIGRHGTMQNALEQLIAEAQLDIQVKGYYVGVSPDAPLVNEGRIQAAGYLHERGRGEEILEKLSPFICIFESIFLAQHGSVKRFVMRDGQPVPELYAFEYEVKKDKSCDEIAIIREYQAGALALVREMNAAFPGGLPQIPYDVAPLHLLRMGLNPTLREAELWGDFRVFDNVVMLMARPKGLGAYLAHPARLKRDFITCLWKIGFLRRLLRVPLPYEKIYLRMKRAFHRRGGGR